MDLDPESAPREAGSQDTAGALQVTRRVADPPSLWLMFLISVKIGLLSFGGGLTGWLYRDFVIRHRWIDEEDFASSMAVSQMLPGPNVINLMIALVNQLHSGFGAFVCSCGLIIGPFFAVIALSAVFDQITDVGLLEALTNGIAFAALGLLAMISLHGAMRVRKFPPAIGVIVVTTICVGFLRWPLIPVVLVMAPVSVALAWWKMRRA